MFHGCRVIIIDIYQYRVFDFFWFIYSKQLKRKIHRRAISTKPFYYLSVVRATQDLPPPNTKIERKKKKSMKNASYKQTSKIFPGMKNLGWLVLVNLLLLFF